MKTILSALTLLIINILNVFSQEIKITEKLMVIKLDENVYMHTSDNNNGLVYTNNGEAIIVSTPWSDELTGKLIDWTQQELNCKIVAYVIDRWHPDAMEGLDVVQKRRIKNYSYELTRTIAKEKKLPIPEIGFDPKLELKVGESKIVCHYLGQAHTSDGIVVWLPNEKVLFGGNEIRNNNGWVGNIGDANLKEWSNTIRKVKEHYGDAKIVIPGHGEPADSELIDYTIKLYQPSKWGSLLRKHNVKRQKVFNDFGKIFEIAEQDSVSNETRFLKDAIVFVDDENRYLKIEAQEIEHQANKKIVKSPYGRLQVYKKNEDVPTTDVYFKELIIILRDDEIGLLIIIKEML